MIKGDKILNGKWLLKGGKIYDPFKDKYLRESITISAHTRNMGLQ